MSEGKPLTIKFLNDLLTRHIFGRTYPVAMRLPHDMFAEWCDLHDQYVLPRFAPFDAPRGPHGFYLFRGVEVHADCALDHPYVDFEWVDGRDV